MSESRAVCGTSLNKLEMKAGVKCLFCDVTHKDLVSSVIHCRIVHSFDLQEIVDIMQLTPEDLMKLILFIRIEKPSVDEVIYIPKQAWINKKLIRTSMSNDPYLDPSLFEVGDTLCYLPQKIDLANASVTVSKDHYKLLNQSIDLLTTKLKKLICVGEEAAAETEKRKADEWDALYFSIYDHHGIHCEMLLDKVRMNAYHNAILQNKSIFEGKVVLDVGCGTGILSLFCAEAGAKKVFAVDYSKIMRVARKAVSESGFEDIIQLIFSKIEETVLPVPKVDLIISEWMGYGLFYEGMLDSVLHARDKFLAPGGLILPNYVFLYICGFSDMAQHDSLFGYWKNVYGFKMTAFQFDGSSALVEKVEKERIITNTFCLNTFNIESCSKEMADFKKIFYLKVSSKTYLTGFCLYFDITFQLPVPISFSTSPSTKPTHWEQCCLWLKTPYMAEKGEIIYGSIKYSKCPTKPRALQITLRFKGEDHIYQLK